jgi:hypothetical protein
MVPMLLVSVSVDRCFVVQLGRSWLRFEWVQMYNHCRVKTIRTATSSVVDNSTLLLLLLVSVTHAFCLPLVINSCLGQLRCEKWEFSYRLSGFWKVCVDPGVQNVRMARVRSLVNDIFDDAHA